MEVGWVGVGINGFKGDGGYQDEKEKSEAGKGGKLGGNWLFKV